MKRNSIVNNVKLQTVNSSAVFQVGDSLKITPKSKALAVQREGSVFLSNEGDFDNYALFDKPIPQPVIDENINMTIINENRSIKTNNIYILSVAAAGVFQIGSTVKIDCESRTKHFRQLLNEPKQE
jgi:spore germination protein PE